MMAGSDSRQDLLATLDWYRSAGVDTGMAEVPQDRFEQSRPNAPKPVVPPTVPARAAAPDARTADMPDAAAIAAGCKSLEDLKAALNAYEGCALKKTATQLCFADGNPDARIMLIGEAPGGEEDRQGKPFVGRAGQLLDRMLGAIGLDRTKVYIVNTVPWRPPGNRNPSPAEIESCRPFLDRQVELAAPHHILSLGKVATETLFGGRVAITRTRGTWRDVQFGTVSVPVLSSFHPAFLLRQPAQKKASWQDLLAFKSALDPSKPV